MGGEVYNNENPIHSVQLDDYELCRYPVSQQLWCDVIGDFPEKIKFRNPHRPVERVSWDEIQDKFLPALKEKTENKNWRLPSEAQWEYAGLGGKYAVNYSYAGSDLLKEVGWYTENSFRETNPMGCKRPNALGLYDMSGNIFEWCEDKYKREYYQQLKDKYGNHPTPNPIGPYEGNRRVVRGGGRDVIPINARISNRDVDFPSHSYSNVGFRLCRYSAR